MFLACFCSAFAADSSSPNKLKVGVVLYLTGPASFNGVQIQQAMILCGDQSKTELVFEDSQYNPTAAVGAFNKLVDSDRVQMVVASGSAVTSAIAPLARRSGIPLLVTAVSSDNVFATGGDVIVRYFPSANEEASMMADFLRTKAQIKKAGVFHIADEYGQSYGDAFAQRFTAQGGEITLNDSFNKEEGDFRLHLMRAAKSKPDLIYVLALNDHWQAILRQAKELHVPYIIASNLILSSPDVFRGRESLMEGFYFTTPAFLNSKASAALEFQERFRNKYNAEPSIWAGIGCDLSRILLKYGNSDPREFRKAVDSIVDYTSVMGKVISKGGGDLSFPMCVSRIKEGKIEYCF